jgi:hypothetical protein
MVVILKNLKLKARISRIHYNIQTHLKKYYTLTTFQKHRQLFLNQLTKKKQDF